MGRNSVWNNTDMIGSFNDAYVKEINNKLRAEASSKSSKEITKAVNEWVYEQTNGMIKQISDDLSSATSVLVNALYLRTSWIDEFNEYSTYDGEFTTIKGNKVTKQLMKQQNKYNYFEDTNTQIVILPMKGNIEAVFVLGDTSDVSSKIEKAQMEEVIVTIPKFEIETTIYDDLVNFLTSQGAGIAMSDDADFEKMSSTGDWRIGDIIQKSKIKVDEDGIEAAAVTAITMVATAIRKDRVIPKEFTADKPFAFYLYSNYDDNPELLFYGRYVE